MEHNTRYDICVAVNTRDCPIDKAQLRRAIDRTLRRHACPAARVSVAVVDDARIAEINGEFLHRAGPTDVITFDLDGTGAELDGEIVVSVETARRQSRARGHSVAAETALYVIHGTLHLLGFDDQIDAGARAMHEEEDRILTELGYGPVYEPTRG